MSMVTKCPHCSTLFRVTPQQLQAHHGQVRCGRCMTVFDGFKGLATLPDQAVPEAGADAVAETGVAASAQPVAESSTAPAIENPSASAVFEMEPVNVPAEAAPAAEPDVPRRSTAGSAVGMAELPLDAAEENPFEAPPRPGPRRHSRAWAVASALLLLVLAGQAAYFYRIELATNYPGLKPALVQMCALIHCSVPLPQRPKLINIEASDLQIVDPARPNVIELTATLRNQAGYDLAYPALDLVLTNTRDHTLARRIFLPEEYLDGKKDVKAGIAANAELTVRLDLDVGDLGAAGFRLGLLPAPAR